MMRKFREFLFMKFCALLPDIKAYARGGYNILPNLPKTAQRGRIDGVSQKMFTN